MNRFDGRWLDRRERADARSRSPRISRAVAQWRPARDEISVIDLGAGTGANARYLAPRLGGSQRWRLIDHDAELLAGVRERMGRWARRRGMVLGASRRGMVVRGDHLRCSLEPVRLELVSEWDSITLRGVDLATASALLDLVSRRWLEALVGRCAREGSAVLLALSYDGRICFFPPHPEDARVRAAVNRHQRRDKGFGPALGPTAVTVARRLLSAAGYRVSSGDSAWRLAAADQALQADLVDGWARAACELEDGSHPIIERWRRDRASLIAAGRSRIEVGHTDLFALPNLDARAPLSLESERSRATPAVSR